MTGARGRSSTRATPPPSSYKFECDLPSWNKPIAFQTYYDAGWKTYSQTLAILADDKEKLAPCLKKLVPLIQQAQVDYIKSPDRLNTIIRVQAARVSTTFWTQSPRS